MAPEPEEVAWPSNYFNYFTEVEEHFQRARGASLFLMSPLDWALVETWKNAGVPLEAVLRGIDAAFEKWRAGKSRIQMVNSVAYCSQAVLAEAQVIAGLARPAASRKPAVAPFSLEELQAYLRANVAEIRKQAGFEEIAASVDRLAAEAEAMYRDLEDLERRLTSLEDKMVAIARARQTDDQLLAARTDLDRELRPYRGKMTAEQLAMLEKQYLERRLLESRGLPRLSLFYLR
jgi:predicted RNase H-like nuclease (RuvC/YqgF family)